MIGITAIVTFQGLLQHWKFQFKGGYIRDLQTENLFLTDPIFMVAGQCRQATQWYIAYLLLIR